MYFRGGMNKSQFIKKVDKLIRPVHDEFIKLRALKEVDIYLVGDCSSMVFPPFKQIVSSIRFTYKYIPLIVIQLWAYFQNDWLLLFGIPASYVGSFIAKHGYYVIGILYLIFCGVVWIDRGFTNSPHFTFPLICMAGGFVFYRQAHGIVYREVERLLISSKKLYDLMLEDNTLLVFRKWS